MDIFRPELSSTGAENSPNPQVRRQLALVVCAAATVFFFCQANHRGIDVAEAQDIGIAHELFATWDMPGDQSPLYYAVLHFWMLIPLHSFVFVRLLSAIFAGLAVMLIFLLMETEAGRTAGLLAAAILALSPPLIHFADLARTYTMIVALAAACLYFLHRYWAVTGRTRDFALALGAAVLGVYAHLFFILLVGPLALALTIAIVKNWRAKRPPRSFFLAAGVGIICLAPQLVRVAVTAGYMNRRTGSGLNYGLSHAPGAFLHEIGQNLLLGQAHLPAWDAYRLIAIVALAAAGFAAIRPFARVAVAVVIVPALAAAYFLNGHDPVQSRYLIFLALFPACLSAAFLARLRWAFVRWPLALLLAANGLASAAAEFDAPLDWQAAGRYIERVRQPGDVVAVYPGYCKWPFRYFYARDDLAPVTFARDLERLLTRTRRVLLVDTGIHDFADLKRYLERHTRQTDKYLTHNGWHVRVTTYEAIDGPPESFPQTEDPAVVLGGLIGSGGYPWQNDPAAAPLARLSDSFKAGDLVLATLESGQPSWADWLKRPWRENWSRKPNTQVAQTLFRSGVGALALLGPDRAADRTRAIIDKAGLKLVSSTGAPPSIFRVKDINVGVLHLEEGSTISAKAEDAVPRAKKAAGPAGKLIVLLPPRPGGKYLFSAEERALAHRAIDLGADAVIGTGHRTVQEIEEYRGGVIAYSLGTLLRATPDADEARNTNGLLLRLRFPRQGGTAYDLAPVIVDDEDRAAFGPREAGEGLVYRDQDEPGIQRLWRRLREARIDCAGPDGHGAVELYGGPSDGRSRRAILFRPDQCGRLTATIPVVTLGARLEVYFGVPDEMYEHQVFPLAGHTLSIEASGIPPLKVDARYLTGWQSASIDTSSAAGERRDVTITLQTHGHVPFPVAVDVRAVTYF